MAAVWASRHEDLVSDGVVSSHVFDPMVVPNRGVVLARCNPPWSAVDAGLDAAARARRAARAADGGVIELIPLSFWYDAPPTSRYSDRRYDPWLVYGLPSYSLARWSSWISPA